MVILTSDIRIDSSDETGQLVMALKDMNEGLRKIVAEVRDSTDTIVTASTEIASGNMDLSSRTESGRITGNRIVNGGADQHDAAEFSERT
jgi:methyl-accepting chemotaxis protein